CKVESRLRTYFELSPSNFELTPRWLTCSRVDFSRRSAAARVHEVGERKGEGGKGKAAEARPAPQLPTERPAIGTERAARKERDHVERVQPAASIRSEIVNARLVGDVTGLHTRIDDDDAQNQAGERPSRNGKHEISEDGGHDAYQDRALG